MVRGPSSYGDVTLIRRADTTSSVGRGWEREEQRTHGSISDVWLPSGSLIRMVTVAEIRARKARAGRRRKQGCRGRGRDLCNYSRSQGVLGPSAMRSRPVKWLDKGGLLHSTV